MHCARAKRRKSRNSCAAESQPAHARGGRGGGLFCNPAPQRNYALVLGTDERERRVAQCGDKRAVDEGVYVFQAPRPRGVFEYALVDVARVAPDVRARPEFEEFQKFKEGFGVVERVAAAERHAVEQGVGVHPPRDFPREGCVKLYAGARVVALGVVAAGQLCEHPAKYTERRSPSPSAIVSS